MNGNTKPRGCPGAVFASGSPSSSYCSGASGKYPWWASCCKFENNKCVPKGCSEYYDRYAKACVNGHNIKLQSDTTIEQCAHLCSMNAGCHGFEYGVAYGGEGTYKVRDCQLSSSADRTGCTGGFHNLDFYARKSTGYGVTCGTTTTTTAAKPTTTTTATTAAIVYRWNGQGEACTPGHDIETVSECEAAAPSIAQIKSDLTRSGQVCCCRCLLSGIFVRLI